MANIEATILSAQEDAKGVAIIVVEFNDGKGLWKKEYKYNQTQAVKFADLKERLIADLKNDLKLEKQLDNIKSQVGKKFTITI